MTTQIKIGTKVIVRFLNNEGYVTKIAYDLDGNVYAYKIEFKCFLGIKYSKWKLPYYLAIIQ